MLRLEEWMDIKSLHKEGHSIKAIARQTGRSRNTVRRVLRESVPAAFHQPERHSQLVQLRSTYILSPSRIDPLFRPLLP